MSTKRGTGCIEGDGSVGYFTKPEINRYQCSVDYRTQAGSCNTWSGIVRAHSIDEASAIAREKISKRKSTLKIDGGSTRLLRT